MKISIDIDCTPEEARAFLGLPNVSEVNDAFVDQLKKHIESGMTSEIADTMVRQWTEASLTGFSDIQKSFWTAMQSSTKSNKPSD